MDQRKSKKRKLILTYLILALVIMIIVYPLVWTIGASFNPGDSLSSTSIIPENPTLNHYRKLFSNEANMPYLNWYWNSLKVSVSTMVLSLIFVSITAYAFSRFRFKGKKNSLLMFMLLQMVPQFSALIAIYILAQLLGMINNHFLLILIYVGGQIPMNTYLLKNYFDTIPISLDENAMLDGASRTTIFRRILLPLAKPMLAVVAMNGFTGPLGDFAISSVVLRHTQYYTLPLGLYQLVTNPMTASYTTFAAGAILISIPIAAAFLMLQKYFITGLTTGGTKG